MEPYCLIAEALEEIAQKQGSLLDAGDDVKGIKTGSQTGILVTACHHAGEAFATYDAVLTHAKNTKHPVTSFPVVDRETFNYYKKQAEKVHTEHFSFFIDDSIRGYKDIPPRKMSWQYGCKDQEQQIQSIETMIPDADLVIDVHNSCMDKYMVIVGPHYEQHIKELSELKSLIESECSIYSGQLWGYEKVEDGIYCCHKKHNILWYAAQCDTPAIALEVPIYDKNRSLRDFDELSRYNSSLIEETIELIGGKK